MDTDRQSRSRLLWLYGCGTFLLVGFVGLVVFTSLTRRRGNETRARILAIAERSIGPLDERFLEDHAARNTNEDARQLEVIAGALGVDLVPRVEKRSNVSPEAAEAFQALAISRFLIKLSESSDPALPEIPEDLAAYCRKYDRELDELAEESRDTTPLWLMDPRQGFASPVANLLGLLKVQRLFLCCAVVRESDGDLEGARGLLDASWELNEERGDRPELISALIRIAVTKYQIGVIRHLETAEKDWPRRLREIDPRAAVAEGMRGEAYSCLYAAENPARSLASGAGPPGKERLLVENPLVRPWISQALYEVVEANVRSHELALRSDVCDFTLADVTRLNEGMLQSANPLTRTIAARLNPHISLAWARANRAAFDVEATERILSFRRALRQTATAPRDPSQFARFLEQAELETGTACREGRWVYEIDPDAGEYVVRWEGPEIRSDFQGVNLPTEHRIPFP